MPKPLTSEDRAFLQENFARYGEAWRPGLAMFEEHFRIEAVRRWRTFELMLTTKDVFALRYALTVHRKNGAMSHRGPELPAGPELSPEDRAAADGALRALGELWLLEPLNSDCLRVDLAGGLPALQKGRTLRTRRVGDRALLFIHEGECDWRLFCASVDLNSRTVEEFCFRSFPPRRHGRWLRAEEVEFIDRHLRQNGDFGVYGSVTMGLRALAENFELRIGETESAFSFSVVPRDGHGHFLRFQMDRRTGEIGGAAAGHMERRPAPED